MSKFFKAFNDNTMSNIIMAVVIIVVLIVVPFTAMKVVSAGVKIALGSVEYKYTTMDTDPKEGSPVDRVMVMLKSLNDPDIISNVKKMCPNRETTLKYMKEKHAVLKKAWEDADSPKYGSRFTEMNKFDPGSNTAIDNRTFNQMSKSDLELRRLVDKGYAYHIDWEHIKLIGLTAVSPSVSMEHFIKLYFEDQGRIFRIEFTALYSEKKGDVPAISGAFIEEHGLIEVDNASGDTFKKLFQKILE